MLRLLKFLITGDWHKCHPVFTHVTSYTDTSYGDRVRSAYYVKVCPTCGKHWTGNLYGCDATSAEALNLDQSNKEIRR